MAYDPVNLGDRRGSLPLSSPYGVDRFDRAQARASGPTAGDWLTLSGAASSRLVRADGAVAADTAHLGVHGQDLARIARGEISYEAWLAER